MPEQLIIDQCSPTLAGLKTGNMFPVSIKPGQDICDELRNLNRLLGEKGIRVVILRRTDKKALFGSYGWGDGQWMRDWEERCRTAGAELAADSVTANDTPGDEEAQQCRNLGAALA